ncbi:MAG: SusD/RagB family nutrient-binding outer membrane lipoprotein [Bacteroidales bacterium]|nr:SusD/RagB family nutrient-binding outer membrane lipoprotein [Bacteroidales bacterium]
MLTSSWRKTPTSTATQAWTDIRRTGYPALYYPADGADNNGYPTVTQRVKYPATEIANNNDNYKAGAALVDNDSAYYTLFWAKKVQ